MNNKITIIDYGVGNLLSVARAFEYFQADVCLTSDPKKIQEADHLVLPGVGAFRKGMQGLNQLGLIEPIHRFCERQRPFLGICLGMQMMLGLSEEFGETQGLNLIPGKVTLIPATTVTGELHKIPHIGWNKIMLPPGVSDWKNTILEGIPPESCFYFVHSFTAFPSYEENRLADCDYNGHQISAVIRKDNLYGCQFHPEKSGEMGLKIIKNFISL